MEKSIYLMGVQEELVADRWERLKYWFLCLGTVLVQVCWTSEMHNRAKLGDQIANTHLRVMQQCQTPNSSLFNLTNEYHSEHGIVKFLDRYESLLDEPRIGKFDMIKTEETNILLVFYPMFFLISARLRERIQALLNVSRNH